MRKRQSYWQAVVYQKGLERCYKVYRVVWESFHPLSLSLHLAAIWCPDWWRKGTGYHADSRLFQIKCAADWVLSTAAMTLCSPGQLWIPNGLVSVFIISETSILLSTFVSAGNLLARGNRGYWVGAPPLPAPTCPPQLPSSPPSSVSQRKAWHFCYLCSSRSHVLLCLHGSISINPPLLPSTSHLELVFLLCKTWPFFSIEKN